MPHCSIPLPNEEIMNTALADELLSINAIFSLDTLVQAIGNDNIFILRIPSSKISLRLLFPASYPDHSPAILGPESAGAETRRGEANETVSIAKNVLSACFRPGQPCLFDLLEELMTRAPLVNTTTSPEGNKLEVPSALYAESLLSASCLISAELDPQWVLSDVITEKKSTFLGRAAHARTPSEAQSFIEHLVTTDKKAANASHNISAWRLRDPSSGALFQDCDDDGESAAGGRLLHLLQVMDVWDVVIVVSRWYGGVHLGPDRFRIINSVARDAILKTNPKIEMFQNARIEK